MCWCLVWKAKCVFSFEMDCGDFRRIEMDCGDFILIVVISDGLGWIVVISNIFGGLRWIEIDG